MVHPRCPSEARGLLAAENRDEPTKASAAAWRGFILFLLEKGIAGSDTSGMVDARMCEFDIPLVGVS